MFKSHCKWFKQFCSITDLTDILLSRTCVQHFVKIPLLAHPIIGLMETCSVSGQGEVVSPVDECRSHPVVSEL